MKSWLIGKDPDAGKDWRQKKRAAEDEMVSITNSIDMNVSKLWEILRDRGAWSQRVRHDLVTEQQLDSLTLKCWEKSEVIQSCPTLCNLMNCSLAGSSVHGILLAGLLECVALPFSRRSSWPRDQTQSPTLQADSLLSEPPDKGVLLIGCPCTPRPNILLKLVSSAVYWQAPLWI